MLGEASHGTQEFYEWRRIISRELIEKHGFRFIAVEGDWPPCWQLNEFAQGRAGELTAVFQHFSRWPTWMWANTEIIHLARWLRTFNQGRNPQAGFYGLDVYSLFESIDAVLSQFDRVQPFLAKRLRERYECFEPFQRNEKAYARSLLQYPEGCEQEALDNLKDLLEARLSGSQANEALFDARQNARIVANAERYYRAMIHGTEDSWNVRDGHMLDTLERLLDHHGPDAKAIVWAHNTHIGDHRATDMVSQGQVNIGGLAREKWGEDRVSLVGFGTYRGDVIASTAWDGPIQRLRVPPGGPGSYEASFHKVAVELEAPAFLLTNLRTDNPDGPLAEVRGHRAIGVVYQPAYERLGNYVPTSLSYRYDAFLFFDESWALEPLDQPFRRDELPETWPQGF
jgi:erythromycin esterase